MQPGGLERPVTRLRLGAQLVPPGEVRQRRQRHIGRPRDRRREHDRADAWRERRAVAGVLARETLLALEEREHVATDRSLGRVVVPDVAGKPGKGERLVAGAAHQHPPDCKHEHRGQALEQDAIGEPLRPRCGPEVERLAAIEEPFSLQPQDSCQLLLRETDLQAEADGHRRRHEGREVGQVAAEDELSRRHEREQRGQIDRVPPGCVDQEVRVARDHPPEPVEVADRRMGEHDPRLRVALGKVDRVAGERRDPAPGVDHQRQSPLVGEREDRLHLGVAELEPLRPRMQLDPARAGFEAAPRLRNGIQLRVEAAERGQPPVRGGGFGNDAIVRRRVAVGLVHRHHDPPCRRRLERRQQLLGREREAVRVVEAGVAVDVHQRHARGEHLASVLVPGPDQLVVVEPADRRADDELEGRLADPDQVARLEPRPLDAGAVHPRAVARAEVLDHERTVVVPANRGVAAGELCVRRQELEPRRRPAQLELPVDRERQP